MEESPVTLDELVAIGIDVNGKATRILGSSLAIVSLILSSTLIWMMKRSRTGFTTTYNRIVLGMAISDIIYSLSLAHFNVTAPSDGSYYVWNASGNQVTCSIQGFMSVAGANSGLLYSCSLNLYSLAVVKYNKPDSYIRSKVEPFLHGVPIAFALITNTTLLAKQNLNDGGTGNCYAAVYRPPHCIGYEDGEIREGFDIPCGRGYDGAVIFRQLNILGTLFLVPTLVVTSLGMIYRSVLKQENNMASYGAGSFNLPIANNIGASTQRIDRSSSRLVLHRAIAYSVSYFLTWGFFIIGSCFILANEEWPMPLLYLANIFNPLQGFFNFVIYIFPKVMRAKSRGDDNTSWFQAFKIAFIGGGTGHAVGRRRPEIPNRTQHVPAVGE